MRFVCAGVKSQAWAAEVEDSMLQAEVEHAAVLEAKLAEAKEGAALRQKEALRVAMEVAAKAQQRAVEAAKKQAAEDTARHHAPKVQALLKQTEEAAALAEVRAVNAAVKAALDKAALERVEASQAAAIADALAVDRKATHRGAPELATSSLGGGRGGGRGGGLVVPTGESAREVAQMQQAILNAVREAEQQRLEKMRPAGRASAVDAAQQRAEI